MCTCGIDIATQQATPATTAEPARRRGQAERTSDGVAGAPLLPLAAADGRRRSSSASGSMVAAQNTPTPM